METTDLIHLTLQGDDDAFTAIFERYKNLIYRTAVLMLADPDDADDALQEVFARAHRALASYDPRKGAFTTWLHQITTNHCLNRRRRGLFSLVSLSAMPMWKNRDPRPVEDRAEVGVDIRRALQSLRPEVRATVILRYYHNLPYAEIAAITGAPLGTVQSRLSRGLDQLRAALRDPGEPAEPAAVEATHELR